LEHNPTILPFFQYICRLTGTETAHKLFTARRDALDLAVHTLLEGAAALLRGRCLGSVKEDPAMPRHRRHPFFAFGWYYVELRAAKGRELVTSTADLHMLLQLLFESLRRNGAQLHAGSVTAVEAHFAVRSGERPPNEITRRFCHDYARWFNRLHGERGSLFQSHPRILLMQHPLWLVRVAHVIHWIPRLRAAAGVICWSSDAAYRNRGRRTGIITHTILRLLTHGARNREVQEKAYSERFDRHPSPEDVHSLARGSPEDPRILGDSAFVAEIWRSTGQRLPGREKTEESVDEAIQRAAVEVLGRVLAISAKLPSRTAAAWKRIATPEQLRSHSRKAPLPMIRALLASYCINRSMATRAQLAKFLGCHPKTLSAQRCRYFEVRLSKLLKHPIDSVLK
jgi:hypothetical protein